jgi:hypothetical protein
MPLRNNNNQTMDYGNFYFHIISFLIQNNRILLFIVDSVLTALTIFLDIKKTLFLCNSCIILRFQKLLQGFRSNFEFIFGKFLKYSKKEK